MDGGVTEGKTTYNGMANIYRTQAHEMVAMDRKYSKGSGTFQVNVIFHEV